MNFDLSDLQRMVQDSADRYLAERFSLEHRRSLRDVANGLDEQAWANFAELGWLSILLPEQLGGFGGSLNDACVLAIALGKKCVSQPYASSAILAATILSGTDAPPAETIAALAAGSARFAMAHAEPAEGHCAEGPRGATLVQDGDHMIFTGQKMMVCDAPSATHFIATASGPQGLSLLLLEADQEGIHCDPYPLIDGSMAADIRFAGVRLGPDAVLAQGDNAQDLLALALDRTRIVHLAQSIGSMEACLDICANYLKERQQFGQPIGNFQSLQHIMADMFVAAHQARSMLYFALSQVDAVPEDRRCATALARLHIAEAAQLVSRQAIQLHGGYGVTDEYEVSHHYRRQMVLEKLHGSDHISAAIAAI